MGSSGLDGFYSNPDGGARVLRSFVEHLLSVHRTHPFDSCDYRIETSIWGKRPDFANNTIFLPFTLYILCLSYHREAT